LLKPHLIRAKPTAKTGAITPEVAVKRSKTLACTRYLLYLCTAKTGAITPKVAVGINSQKF
jgi:hypothetical protein